jgi:hypothetical protein
MDVGRTVPSARLSSKSHHKFIATSDQGVCGKVFDVSRADAAHKAVTDAGIAPSSGRVEEHILGQSNEKGRVS